MHKKILIEYCTRFRNADDDLRKKMGKIYHYIHIFKIDIFKIIFYDKSYINSWVFYVRMWSRWKLKQYHESEEMNVHEFSKLLPFLKKNPSFNLFYAWPWTWKLKAWNILQKQFFSVYFLLFPYPKNFSQFFSSHWKK